MGKNRNRGIVQIVIEVLIIIYFWIKIPDWEPIILELINKEPNSLSVFGNFWNDIVWLFLKGWPIISFILLLESLYAIIENRNFVADVINWIKK